MTRAEAFLKSLVDESSPTTESPRVRAAHFLLAQALMELGFSVAWTKDPAGKSADLLVAEKPGTGPKYITCVSHIDTVLPTKEAGLYRKEVVGGVTRARGAGIIDNKGGLAIMIESLRLFFEKNPSPEVGFRVVSSPDEETGSSSWHSIFRDIGTRSSAALGFEPALDDGSIISSRRGNRWLDIEIEGIEAHAGRCQGEQINAAHESAWLITRLIEAKLELQEKFQSPPGLGISLQVGHIEGGRDRHNVVCGNVRIKLDTRFSTFEERDALHEKVLEILKAPHEKNLEGRTSKIDFQIVDDCPPFSIRSDDGGGAEALVQALRSEIQLLENREVSAEKAGGAGDVNHMSRPRLLVLDGLGPVGGRMHTVDEFMLFDSLETRSKALAAWYPKLIEYILKS